MPAERFLEFAHNLISSGEIDTVVCERFIINARTAQFTQAPWSLEQIGALRFMCAHWDVTFQLQNVADAKGFATEKRLKEMEWARPRGDGHARDAQRHMVVYLAKHGLVAIPCT